MLKLILFAFVIASTSGYLVDQVLEECSENTGVFMQPYFFMEKYKTYTIDNLRDLDDQKYEPPAPAPKIGSLECDESINATEIADLFAKSFKDPEESYECPCYFDYSPRLTLRSLVQVSKSFECCMIVGDEEVDCTKYSKAAVDLSLAEITSNCSQYTGVEMKPSYYKTPKGKEPVYDNDYLGIIPKEDAKDGSIACDKKLSAKKVVSIMKKREKGECKCYFNYRQTLTLRSLVQNSKQFECCLTFANRLENPELTTSERLNVHMDNFLSDIERYQLGDVIGNDLVKELTKTFFYRISGIEHV